MKLAFDYKGKEIEFEVIYRKRRTMEIRIMPPDTVMVIAPLKVPQNIIIERVEQKAPWIMQKLLDYNNIGYEKIEKQFVENELFMYLGKLYPLKIRINQKLAVPCVQKSSENICVTIHKADCEIVHNALEKWYRQETKLKAEERVKEYQKFFPSIPKEIRAKEQKRRWASCTFDNKILFNWRCVMAPIEVFDYIVVHEMCHMVYKNHSKLFWDLVGSILPDYKKSIEWLKNNGFKMQAF